MIDFLKLPVDIQDDIVMMCNFDVATYKVFKNKYFHLLQNHSNMIRIMDDVIVHSKNEVLCLLIKDGFLNEANLIGVFQDIFLIPFAMHTQNPVTTLYQLSQCLILIFDKPLTMRKHFHQLLLPTSQTYIVVLGRFLIKMKILYKRHEPFICKTLVQELCS